MKRNDIKVKSLEHLKQLLDANGEDPLDCYILLNGGFSSSKTLSYDGDKTFFILNEIDDTEQELTEEELFDRNHTNIGYAIENGAFFVYNYE